MPSSYITESTSLQNPEVKQSIWKRCCNYDKSDGFSVIALAFFAFSLILTALLVIQINIGILEVNPDGSVSSDDGICSEVGVRMIREGGSSGDATVATLLCLCVTQPHVVGPGGGGMILVHDHKLNETKIFDFMVKYSTEDSRTGIPGFLKGLKRIHRLYGKLSWGALFQPAINLARNGFIVSENLKRAVDSAFGQLNANSHFPSDFRAEFSPNGIRIAKGALFSRPKFAGFLNDVSLGGEDELYLLKYGVEMIDALQFLDPNISVQGFHNYEVIERKPIKKLIQNVSIATAGPPFGGFQVIAGLQLMRELGVSPQTHPNKLYAAFSKVLQVVDSNSDFFNKSSLLSMVSNGLGGPYLRPPLGGPYLRPPLGGHPASQVAVVDTFDIYMAAVVGLGDNFGSGLMTQHGIILNGVSHVTPEPLKSFDGRRLSSFAPLVASEPKTVCGQRVLLSSSSWNDVLQVLTQLIFRNLDLIPAITEPRISLGDRPNVLLLNDFGDKEKVKRLPTAVREYLRQRNYTLLGQHAPSAVDGLSKNRDLGVTFSDARAGGRAVNVREEGKEL